MESGRIVQAGPPRELYEAPINRFVATFLGSPPMNLLPCEPGGPLADRIPPSMPGPVTLGIRSEDVALATPDDPRDPGLFWLPLDLPVLGVSYQGDAWTVTVGEWAWRLNARVPGVPALAVGALAAVGLDLRRASWFDSATGLAIARGWDVRGLDVVQGRSPG
jgi:ABC-type sugar transport system ATPase subunit